MQECNVCGYLQKAKQAVICNIHTCSTYIILRAYVPIYKSLCGLNGNFLCEHVCGQKYLISVKEYNAKHQYESDLGL